MNEIIRTTHTPTERADDRRSRAPSKFPVRVGEMIFLILIAVAAALLTGVLTLPFTMPGQAFADPLTAFGAADAGPTTRPARRLLN